jgi:hypothetical protein
MEWYTNIELKEEDYKDRSYSLSKVNLDKLADLYWIPNPEYPDDINEGYIGITNRGYITRVSEHYSSPGNSVLEIALMRYPEIKPILLGKGSYINALKCENYLRPKWYMGWNVCPGGNVEGWNTEKSVISKRLADEARRSLGERTSVEKGWDTYKNLVLPKLIKEGKDTRSMKISKANIKAYNLAKSKGEQLPQSKGWDTYRANKTSEVSRELKVRASLLKIRFSKEPELLTLAEFRTPEGTLRMKDTLYSIGELFSSTGHAARSARNLFNLMNLNRPIKRGPWKGYTVTKVE